MKATKFQEVKTAVESGDYKKALGIARKFFFGLTDEEKRCIEIAADALNGRQGFYTALGIDTAAMLEKAKVILRQKYATT